MSDSLTVSLPLQRVLIDTSSATRGLLLDVERHMHGEACPDGYLVVEREEQSDVLLLFSHAIHSALRFSERGFAGLPVTTFFQELLARPLRRVRLCRAQPGLVLLAAVVFQNKPAFKANAAVADLERQLLAIRTSGKGAAILLTRGMERNLVYCRDGVPIAAYFAQPAAMAAEASVHDQILAYAYVAPAETTVEVFHDLDSRRDEHANRRFGDLIEGRVGPPPFMLSVMHGSERLQRRVLESGTAKVGRDPANDIVIDHLSVSRHHCTVAWEETAFTVRDAGSANGTHVNGVKVEQSTLSPGDRIAVGDFELLFGTGDAVQDEELLKTVFVEPAGPQPSPHLLVAGAPVPVGKPVFTIGKGTDASLQLSGLFIKPIQATIVREGGGRYRLLRVEGGKAVRVGGREVGAGGEILASGAEITIGRHTLVFILPEDA